MYRTRTAVAVLIVLVSSVAQLRSHALFTKRLRNSSLFNRRYGGGAAALPCRPPSTSELSLVVPRLCSSPPRRRKPAGTVCHGFYVRRSALSSDLGGTSVPPRIPRIEFDVSAADKYSYIPNSPALDPRASNTPPSPIHSYSVCYNTL